MKKSEVVKKEVNGNDSEAKIAILEQENLELKQTLWNYEQEQKVDNIEKDLEVKGRFKDLYNDAKVKLVKKEKQIATFRSDLL